MRKQQKCVLAYMLIMLLLFTGITFTDTKDVRAEEISDEESIDMSDEYDVKVDYHVTGSWEGHCNVDVTLTNLLEQKIDDWEIKLSANYEIENIWNARIKSRAEGEYTIHNAEWNQDIQENGKVTFGMTVKCDEEVSIPEYAVMNNGRYFVENETDYKVEYTEYSSWDDHVNGKVTITNLSDHRIEDWTLKMRGRFSIENIWNASVLEQDEELELKFYELENEIGNQNIDRGQSVEFGFIVSCKDELKIEGFELTEMRENPKDLLDIDVDDDDPDYDLSECILDADYFDSAEEFEAYWNSVMPSETKTYARAKQSPMPSPIPCQLENVFQFGGSEKAVQNYLPVADGVYTFQHIAKDVLLKKGTYSGNDIKFPSDEGVRLAGFAHGQTFEQFLLGNREYYLLAGYVKDIFARRLTILKKEYFEKIIQKNPKEEKNFDFSQIDTKENLLMTGLQYANKFHNNYGRKTYRVDAALTADGSTMVIWKKLTGKPMKVEISLYDMKKLRKLVSSKGVLKGKFSFRNLDHVKLKYACIGSYSEIYNNKDSSKYVLFPNASFQSIDIERDGGGNDKWKVYITSGNQKVNKRVSVTRIDITKKGRNIDCVPYRRYLSFPGMDADDIDFEIEGSHVVGNRLNFALVRYRDMDEKKEKRWKQQFIASVARDQIETKLKK